MADAPIDAPDVRDPFGRDPQRSPMQWDASPNAGFTAPGVRPWLPLAPDAGEVNVAAQAEDLDSLLSLTRRLLRLRREHPVLRLGDFEPFGPSADGTFAFHRISPDGRLTVVLNLTDTAVHAQGVGSGHVLIGTDRDREGAIVSDVVELRPNEGIVVEGGGV